MCNKLSLAPDIQKKSTPVKIVKYLHYGRLLTSPKIRERARFPDPASSKK